MNDRSPLWVVIPAAGSGERMGADVPKQYLPLLNRPILLHTIERLCRYVPVFGVWVGLSPNDTYWKPRVQPYCNSAVHTFVGGATRAQTVLNGLKALPAADTDWVMVHDAVRPCVRHSDLDKLIAAVQAHVDGALLALPLTDTLKRANAERQVEQTIPRDKLWRALTPQLFKVGALRAALSAAFARGVEPTDEAAAMEASGARPLLVAGSPDNIKITVSADLALAELYLKQQQASGE